MTEAPQAPESVEEKILRYLMTFRRFFIKLSALMLSTLTQMCVSAARFDSRPVCIRRVQLCHGPAAPSESRRCFCYSMSLARRSRFGMVHLQHRFSAESSLCLWVLDMCRCFGVSWTVAYGGADDKRGAGMARSCDVRASTFTPCKFGRRVNHARAPRGGRLDCSWRVSSKDSMLMCCDACRCIQCAA